MSALHSTWFEAVGLIAACLTTSAYLPQAFRIWRSRSARDVSLVMYVMMTSGTVLWLAYGLLVGSLSLIAANVAGLLMVGSVLVLKVQDMLRPRNLLVEIVEAEATTETGAPVNSNEAPSAQPPAAA
ncbi:MAG TPA: SemiSWEET transporter [Candidatus Cybelea sp.]|nr:SemiSWEET transporter [Candidatus Cybelea sp.]